MLVWIISAIMFLLMILHVYWGIGGTWGANAVVPEFKGKKTATVKGWRSFLVAAGLLVGILVVLGRMQVITLGLPEAPYRIGIWLVTAFFAMRALGDRDLKGFMKKEWSTSFGKMDTMLISPLCLLVAVGLGYLAVAG